MRFDVASLNLVLEKCVRDSCFCFYVHGVATVVYRDVQRKVAKLLSDLLDLLFGQWLRGRDLELVTPSIALYELFLEPLVAEESGGVDKELERERRLVFGAFCQALYGHAHGLF